MTDTLPAKATDHGRVTTEVAGRVILIGIDRPSRRNALTPTILRELSTAYARFDHDDALRCAVLFGHGDVFSAGFDVSLLKEAIESDAVAYGSGEYDPFGLSGERLHKPLVVAVHGVCFAGALEIALASDIIVAAEGTLLGQPEVNVGVFAFGGGAVRWQQRVGWGNAQRYLLTGEPLSAEEAHRIGLVQDVVSPEALMERASGVASRIARMAPLGVRDSLAVSRLALEDPTAAVDEMARRRRDIIASDDAAAGLRAFVEKREASYSAR